MVSADWVPSGVDTERPSAARIYDYIIGGGHNFEIDREYAAKALKINPDAREIALANRAFLRRAVGFMIDNGIRQFLDLGSGIPTAGNVHEIAQLAAPESRVVYVDSEQVAAAHTRLILEGNDQATMIHADATRTADVLEAEETKRLIDFDQPLGLMAITLFHYVSAEQDPFGTAARYRSVCAPGSCFALTHATPVASEGMDQLTTMMKSSQNNVFPRPVSEARKLFGDFELVEPGFVPVMDWRPETGIAEMSDLHTELLYGGIGVLHA
jgi:hypothetical protein